MQTQNEKELEKLKYYIAQLKTSKLQNFKLLSHYYSWLKSFILRYSKNIQLIILKEINVNEINFRKYLECVENEELKADCIPTQDSQYFNFYLFITKYVLEKVCNNDIDCMLKTMMSLKKLLKKDIKTP